MEGKLASSFILELFKSCLEDKKVLNICKQYLKYTFLENDAQKKVFKFIVNSESLNQIPPSIGIIAQAFSADEDILNLLTQLKKTNIPTESKDQLITSFEEFIKKSKFVELFNNAHDLYQSGKHDDAILLVARESKEINEFKLKDEYYTTVFKDYDVRNEERMLKAEQNPNIGDKMPWGIRELDEITFGGIKRGTSALLLAQSGKGKTTALRWVGIANARIGKKVVHFQIEGTEEECLEGYDAAWTGSKLSEFDTQDYGNISEATKKKILTAKKNILANKGEIYIYASESFDSMTIERCRDIIKDIEEQHGKVDLVIFDYLEVMNTTKDFGKGEVAERRRREYIANQITNISIELKVAAITATQANDISPQQLINPEFVLTRHHISEFKGCLKPFSYFITINGTPDEHENDIARLYCDKFRRYRDGQTITIATKKDIGRFYDHLRTIRDFYKE